MSNNYVTQIESVQTIFSPSKSESVDLFFQLKGLTLTSTGRAALMESKNIEKRKIYMEFCNLHADAAKQLNELLTEITTLSQKYSSITLTSINSQESGDTGSATARLTVTRKTAASEALIKKCKKMRAYCIYVSSMRTAVYAFLNATSPFEEYQIAENRIGYAFEGLCLQALGSSENIDGAQAAGIKMLQYSPTKYKMVQAAAKEAAAQVKNLIETRFQQYSVKTVTNVRVGDKSGDLAITLKNALDKTANIKIVLECKWQKGNEEYLKTITSSTQSGDVTIASTDSAVRWFELKDSTLFPTPTFESYLKDPNIGYWATGGTKFKPSTQWTDGLTAQLAAFMDGPAGAGTTAQSQMSYLLQKGSVNLNYQNSIAVQAGRLNDVAEQVGINQNEKFIIRSVGNVINDNGATVKFQVTVTDIADIVDAGKISTVLASLKKQDIGGAIPMASEGGFKRDTVGKKLRYSAVSGETEEEVMNLGYSFSNPGLTGKDGSKFKFNVYLAQKYLNALSLSN